MDDNTVKLYKLKCLKNIVDQLLILQAKYLDKFGTSSTNIAEEIQNISNLIKEI